MVARLYLGLSPATAHVPLQVNLALPLTPFLTPTPSYCLKNMGVAMFTKRMLNNGKDIQQVRVTGSSGLLQ